MKIMKNWPQKNLVQRFLCKRILCGKIKIPRVNDGKHCRFLPVHRGWYWNWQSRWRQNSTLRFMRNGKRRTKTGLRTGSCHRLRKNPHLVNARQCCLPVMGRNCKATEPWGWAGIRQTFWKSWNGNRIRRQKKKESMEKKVLFFAQAIRSVFHIRSQGRPIGWMCWK